MRLESPALRHVPIGIVITGPAGIIREINAPALKILGAHSADDVIGLPLRAVVTEKGEETLVALSACAETGKVQAAHCMGKTRAGSLVDCQVTVAPLSAAEDSAAGLEIFLVDVSERTVLAHSLMQAEKLSALGEIVAGVAHELNNPLTGILGYAQLLLSKKCDEAVRKRLEQIAIEAQRCTRIVQGLLGFSRYYESDKSEQDLNTVLADTLLLREYQMRVDNIAITTELDENLPRVVVDPHELQRVFLNIINNAHHALLEIHDRPRVFQVRTGVEGQNLFLEFADNGPGMSEDTRSKVFDPFFTTKDIGEGTGLGLSVSYGVVQDHGGRILVHAEPGSGATFRVVLPISDSSGS